MRKKLFKTLLIIFSCSLLPLANAFASYYCAESNQVVNEGDPMEKVQEICGPPTAVAIKEEIASEPIQTEEWVYIHRPPAPTKSSDYLPFLIVIFDKNERAAQIKQNPPVGQDPTEPVVCSFGTIKIGDIMPTVRLTCGEPAVINKRESSIDTTKKIVMWTYKKNPYTAPVTFQFEDGILKRINTGQ
jgi:hypothetical protein